MLHLAHALGRPSAALAALLLVAAPTSGWASSLQIFESTLGSQGVTASFPFGSGLIADLDYDASTAEGGDLELAPTDIIIRPFGGVSFAAFTCQLGSCSDGTDYLFTPGGEGTGQLELHDTRGKPLASVFDLGLLEFDAASAGSIELISCSYTDGNAVEHSCAPFTLVTAVPEPGSAALLGLGLGALALRRRALRRRGFGLQEAS